MTIARLIGLLPTVWISSVGIQAGVTGLSVILTGGLVYLYHEQRKLNAIEYTADLQAEGHRPSDDGRDLDVCISNLGRGAATDLTLRIEISFPKAEDYSGGVVEEKPIKRIEQPNGDDVRNEWARPRRNYVGPEQYFVRFWTTAPVQWTAPDGETNRTRLANVANELPDFVDRVRLTITLDYGNQTGVHDSRQIVDDVLPLKAGGDLECLFSRGMTYDEYKRRKTSDTSADPFESLAVHRPQLTEGFRTSERNGRKDRPNR